MSETPEHCTKSRYEPCAFHPVDCENCLKEPWCQMKATMKAYPRKIKSCRFFRKKGPQRTLTPRV